MTGHLSPIVVGVDGSAGSLTAAMSAAEEAHRRLLPVRLVQAVPGRTPGRRGTEDRLEALRGAVRDRLPGGLVTTTLSEGPAAQVLLQEAGTADMLVVGPPGGPPDEVVDSLARLAPCPVLVARDALAAHGPVVVGIDDDDATRLLSAAALQAATRSTSLVVLDVGRAPAGTARLGERVKAVRAAYPGVPVEWRPATRADLPTLLTASRTAALLVVGRTAPLQPADRRLGELLRRSAAPVLVVPLDVPAPSSPGPVRALTLSGDPA